MTGRRKITQEGYGLVGLSYSNDCLYVLEQRHIEAHRFSFSLAVYQVHGDSGDITLVERLELGMGVFWPACPRIENHSKRVFIPCENSGVTVARLDSDRLVREKTLTCASNATSVDAVSPDTIYVCDVGRRSVLVVDVRDDSITSMLNKPDKTRSIPYKLAVLGDCVMVSYDSGTLTIYRHGSPDCLKVIPWNEGVLGGSILSTDCQHNFLEIKPQIKSQSVYVRDVSGNLRHTVNFDSDDSHPVCCAVVNRQLWVGCQDGDIVIMTSQ